MDNEERTISVPNTVGEVIDFLKQFPIDNKLNIVKEFVDETNNRIYFYNVDTIGINMNNNHDTSLLELSF